MRRVKDKDNKIKELRKLLKLQEDDKTSLKHLVTTAFYKGLVDFDYFKECNGDCKVTTIKRYLRTIIEHKPTLKAINEYVKTYSQLFSTGSKFYNAFLLYCFENKLINSENNCQQIIEQTFLKYTLLPFKNELSGTERPNNGMYEHLWNFWDAYQEQFMELFPSREQFDNLSWDQSITRLQSVFKTNLINHIVIHYNTRVQKFILHNIIKSNEFVEKIRIINGISRKIYKNKNFTVFKTKLFNLIIKGNCELEYEDQNEVNDSEIPENIIKHIKTQREHFGFNDKDNLQTKKFKYDLTILKRHFELLQYFEDNKIPLESDLENLSKEDIKKIMKQKVEKMNDDEKNEWNKKKSLPKLKAFSVAPICRLQRCYSYIDNRVIESMIKKNEELKTYYKDFTLEEVFKVNRKKWKKINSKVRKKIRKNKKSRKQKKKAGYSLLPNNLKVQSITTDGIGISISIYLPPEEQDNKEITMKKEIKDENNKTKKSFLSKKLKEYQLQKTKGKFSNNKNYHVIAFDDGRENLFQSAQRNGDKFVTTRLKDSEYKRKSKVIQHREWYKEYKERFPEYQKSIEKLSEDTWRTGSLNMFMETVKTFSINFSVHYKYNVEGVKQAKWRMLLWRKKLSIMSQMYSHTVRKVKNLPKDTILVMAIGDAKITSTGLKGKERKRHGGCPTNRKHKIMERTLKCMRRNYEVLYVDEYNTSQYCHKCEKKMKDHYEDNKVVRGLKDCHSCSQNALKTRNRDLNASINILKIAECFIKGIDRPSYLQRKKKCSAKHSKST